MVWYGMVWYDGMEWNGMVWYDMEWYEVSIPWYDGIGIEVIPLLEWGTTKVP